MIEPYHEVVHLGLSGRVAIVAGGTYGIGLAVARKLCDSGVHVVVTCDEGDANEERADLVLSGRSGSASVVPVVAGKADAVSGMIEDVFAYRGWLDVYVHHVTSPDLSPLLDASAALIKAMGEGGRVVITGLSVIPVDRVVRRLALELAPHGIAVNAVATPFVDHGPMGMDPDLVARLAIRCPSGRVTVPDDVADVVALLCAPEAGWLRGQVIVVDGGLDLAGTSPETR